MSRVGGCLKYVTVEPVAFFTFLGLVMYQLVRDTGLYRTVCLQNYGQIPEVNCFNLTTHPEVENDVQRRTTLWTMTYSLCVLLPAMFSDILLGAWGDRRGRKTNMLLGVVGTMVSIVPLIALLTFSHMPIFTVLFANIICGLMGSSAIVMVSSYAFLADHIDDHNLLTVRMAIVSVSIAAGIISGSYFTGQLMQVLTLPQTLAVVTGMLAVGFFYCMVRLSDEPPPSRKHGHHQNETSERPDDLRRLPHETDGLLRCSDKCAGRECWIEVILTFRYAKQLLKEVWHTFTKKRPRNHRAYMLIGVVCFHVATLADFQGNVVTLFTYRRPLNWTPSMLSTWKACHGIINLIGNLFGAIFLKRVLKVQDTTLILLGMSSSVAQNVVLGMSTHFWMVYLSSGVGLFSTIVQPTVASLTTRLVMKDEVGKAFAAFTLAAETALILSVVLLNAIYESTVSYFPGFVFFFVAGCVVLMTIPMIWVHRNYNEKAEDVIKQQREANGQEEESEEGGAPSES